MSTYIADSADFTALANAIRAKGGTNAQLSFPSGMAAAIAAIPSATEPYMEATYNSGGQLTGAVLHGYTVIHTYAFYRCTSLASITLPNTLESINSGAFTNCSALALATLPSGLRTITQNAFSGCTALAITAIPASVTTVASNAFNGCAGLTAITFLGTPTTLHSAAFNGCTNIATINVPWAEGAISGAPWGAENATVNYGYTGV